MKKHFLLACVVFCCGQVHAYDWLEHRGPKGQGIAEVSALPIEWSKEKNVTWRKELPGTAWSTPLYKQGRLYLTNAIESEGKASLRALCLDAKDGSIVWDREIFESKGPLIKHDKNSHASSTPIIEGDRLYVHFGYQGLACLDLNGKSIWENRDLYYNPTHGNGGSPAIVEDLIVFTCDGTPEPFIAALDKMTGALKWKTVRKTEHAKKFSFGTPLFIEAEGRKQIITQASGAIFAYDLQGKELWHFNYSGYSVVPKPLYEHGLLYISSGYDRSILYVIKPTGSGDVTESHLVYKVDKEVPKNPSFLMIGQELYMQSDKGTITCLNALTGEVYYQEARHIRNSSASPIAAAGKLYFTDEKGSTIVVAAGKTFQLLATNSIEERVLASMAVTEGTIFLRSEQALYCISEH